MNLKQFIPGSIKSFFSFNGQEVSVGERNFLQLLNLPASATRPTLRESVSHALVFACLCRKIEAVQDVLPVVESRSGSEWRTDERHPALMPLLRPNDQQSWSDFFSSLLIDEDVWGRWYVEIVRSASGAVVGLIPLDVRGLREIDEYGATLEVGTDFFWNALPLGRIVRYDVVDSRRTRTLTPDDVLSYRSFDVRSPLAGMSRVMAALKAVGIEKSFATYISTYLNAGGPSHILRFKDKVLTEQQAAAIQERWDKNYSLGGRRAGKTAVLDQSGELQQMGAHLGDLAADAISMQAQADICAAMGVPGQLVSAYFAIRWGNQRAGQESALQQFWELWGSPTTNRYGQHLTRFYLPQFEPSRAAVSLRVRLDTSAVKALQEDADKLASRSRADFSAGICSLNETRVVRGLKPVQGGDEIPALLRQEAARLAPGAQQAGQGRDQDEQGQPQAGKRESLPAKETKAYNWEGLKLSRQPTDAEAKVIRQIARAQDTAREQLLETLTDARRWLVEDGLKKLALLAEGSTLTLPKLFRDDIRARIGAAIEAGRATVSASAVKADTLTKVVDRIVRMVALALVNQVAGRLVSEYLRRLLRGVEDAEAHQAVATWMKGESLSYVEDIASGGAYEAVAEGRAAQFESLAQPGDRWIYSAILDANTCDVCNAADLTEADDPGKLPPAPNPECAGRWRCRCQHILVRD